MTGVENNLQQNQPSCLAALSPAAFPDMNHSPFTTHNSPKRKVAFTLAEVLITLGIIGVVAAITMPVLLSNVQDRVKQKRVENIKQKLSKNGTTSSYDNHTQYCAIVYFDVNGQKAPNQFGKDVFSAIVYKDKVVPDKWAPAGGKALINILSGIK